MSHPVVDRLDTRLLEDRQVVRSFVWSTEVAAVETRSLELRTIDGVSSVFTRFPEGAPVSPASRDRDRDPRHPLYVREGGLVPLGPVMSYVDERATDEITLRLAPFAGDGETVFGIPLAGKTARVRYAARGGRHEVTLPSAPVRFDVEVLGSEPPLVETRASD